MKAQAFCGCRRIRRPSNYCAPARLSYQQKPCLGKSLLGLLKETITRAKRRNIYAFQSTDCLALNQLAVALAMRFSNFVA